MPDTNTTSTATRASRRSFLVAGAALLLGPASSRADAPAATGRVSGSVTVFRQGLFRRKPLRSHADVVVYLEGSAGAAASPPAAPHDIHQIDKHFEPAVSAVVVGTTVGFPNDDKIFHNVFSLSRAARFDLGLYKSGTTKYVTVDTPGVIDVYCNIHPEMAAKILVLESSLFALTPDDGAFEIAGVPPGTYKLVAWQAHGEPWSGEVVVTEGQATRLEIELIQERAATDHTRKDGTPYGRYR